MMVNYANGADAGLLHPFETPLLLPAFNDMRAPEANLNRGQNDQGEGK
jgi:hypothetical protein